MQYTPKQREMMRTLIGNMGLYYSKLYQLDQTVDLQQPDVFDANLETLVENLEATAEFINELREENAKVAEKEAGQYA